ncbi:Uncharacterized protein TCM_032740 [Theobroma cacao]|uniref:Uncharacterized protein n=1 Tax=Theobroma cacao TaxID=3641 RepID=A0A061FB12_THECC|nr:Uncharacterized protein TCM_032740 [Theobroma cacao]
MENFRQVVNDEGLMDFPLTGSKFTWHNKKEEVIFSRLDRYLIIMEVLGKFQNLRQECLNSSPSNHNLAILGVDDIDWGFKPFCLFNHYLNEKGLRSFAEAWEANNKKHEGGGKLW